MRNLVLFFVIMFSLTVQAIQTPCIEFSGHYDIQVQTKLLKTFTFQYWQIAEKEILGLPTEFKKKGFVVGDYHFNNVGLYYDYLKNKTEMTLNDFDDAGFNYLIIDLMKFITFIKKLDKNIDLTQLINNYALGVQNKNGPTMPAEIRYMMSSDQATFAKSYGKYITNKKDEFNSFEKSKLSTMQNNKFKELMQLKIIRQLSGVDYMLKINDSGSSKDQERYAFWGYDPQGVPGIIEFKKLKCSATGEIHSQDLAANFAYIKKTYLSNITTSSITNQSIYLSTNETYLVRQKINTPLKKLNFEKMPTQEFQQYADFYSFYLGTIHAKSADASYIELLQTQGEVILKTAKRIAKIFIEATEE